MDYCNKCGCPMNKKDTFCSKCGSSGTITSIDTNNYSRTRLIICGFIQIFFGWLGLGRTLLMNFTRGSFYFFLTVLGLFLAIFPMVVLELTSQSSDISWLLFFSSEHLSSIRIAGFGLIGVNILLSVIDGLILIFKGSKKSSCCLSSFGVFGVIILFNIACCFGIVSSINYKVLTDSSVYESTLIEDTDVSIYVTSTLKEVDNGYATYTIVTHRPVSAYAIYFFSDDGKVLEFANIYDLKASYIYEIELKIPDGYDGYHYLNEIILIIDYDSLLTWD